MNDILSWENDIVFWGNDRVSWEKKISILRERHYILRKRKSILRERHGILGERHSILREQDKFLEGKIHKIYISHGIFCFYSQPYHYYKFTVESKKCCAWWYQHSYYTTRHWPLLLSYLFHFAHWIAGSQNGFCKILFFLVFTDCFFLILMR